jgi:MFS family permease
LGVHANAAEYRRHGRGARATNYCSKQCAPARKWLQVRAAALTICAHMSGIHSTTSAADSSAVGYAEPGTKQGTPPDRLTPQQWKSGIAAWLGWLFDGLDMHLYTIVAAPFVASLLHAASATDPEVRAKSSWIQAAFLVGWALGGGFFGRLGDRLGRSRALGLTILTYATFTGLSFFAQTWWQLMMFRFLAALGIGGEWAVGSALLAETWPARYRPWAAAVLQTAVNLGVLLACAVTFVLAEHQRAVFLVGVLPAVVVYWVRKSVPEPREWLEAKAARAATSRGFPVIVADHGAQPIANSPAHSHDTPGFADLFRGNVRRTTLLTIVVCACSLTAWWAFMFWINQHLRNLKDLAAWAPPDRERLVSISFFLLIGTSIAGNFFAALLAKLLGYRRAIAAMFLGFFLAMAGAFCVERGHVSLMRWVPCVGFFSGVFGLFTMYLPPLFPTLLRTTGAGFSYNIGRLAAAFGTIFFGLFAKVGDFRIALLLNSLLLIPAMLVALALPELEEKQSAECKVQSAE